MGTGLEACWLVMCVQPPVEGEAGCGVGPESWAPRTVSVAGETWEHSSSDVSIAGLGWLGVAVKGEAVLRVWAPEGVAVAVREAMVFDMARAFERPGFSVSPLPSPGSSSPPTARGRASTGAGRTQRQGEHRGRASTGAQHGTDAKRAAAKGKPKARGIRLSS